MNRVERVASTVIVAIWGAVSYHLAPIWASFIIVRLSGTSSLGTTGQLPLAYRDFTFFHGLAMALIFATFYLVAALLVAVALRAAPVRLVLGSALIPLILIAILETFKGVFLPANQSSHALAVLASFVVNILIPALIMAGTWWLAQRSRGPQEVPPTSS